MPPAKTRRGWMQVSRQRDGARIVLSLESKDEECLEAARALLLASLPGAATVTSEEKDSASLSRSLSRANLASLANSPSEERSAGLLPRSWSRAPHGVSEGAWRWCKRAL